MNLKPPLIFVSLIVVTTVLVSGIYAVNHTRIQREEQRHLLANLNQLLPPTEHENDLLQDKQQLPPIATLHQNKNIWLYRAKQANKTTAVIFDITTEHGYSGDIRLLVAVDKHCVIKTTKVIAHQETPGLGDKLTRDKSNWISVFDHRSLENPDADGWHVKKDGGQFDQWTGATITPRAVTQALKITLDYCVEHQRKLFTDD